MKLIISIATLFIFCSKLVAENPEWMAYTYGEFVTALASDSVYLWIGTDGGLVQFDKTTEKMTFYNKANALPDNHVRALAIDKDNNIWIGTYQGLTRFDGSVWHTFNKENSDLPSNYITTIAFNSTNTLLLGNERWLTVYDGQDWESLLTGAYDPYVNIADIKFDSKGNTWIGASWGVGIFNDDSISIIGDRTLFNDVNCLAIDSADNIWAGDSRRGLFKYDGSWTHYDTSNSNIPDNRVYDLCIDKGGNLWGGTNAHLFKLVGEDWEIFHSENTNLPNDAYFVLESDRNNSLWLGTGSGYLGNGLYKYNGIDWKHYSTSSSGLINNLPYSIVTDDRGNVWIGYLGRKTIQKYNGSSWQTYTVENIDYFNSEFTQVCNEDSTKIWRGHDLILYFIGRNWAGVYSGKKKNISDYVISDSHGNIWLTSQEGVIKSMTANNGPFILRRLQVFHLVQLRRLHSHLRIPCMLVLILAYSNIMVQAGNCCRQIYLYYRLDFL
jgi:ligand-binding sensor domain-containing protein